MVAIQQVLELARAGRGRERVCYDSSCTPVLQRLLDVGVVQDWLICLQRIPSPGATPAILSSHRPSLPRGLATVFIDLFGFEVPWDKQQPLDSVFVLLLPTVFLGFFTLHSRAIDTCAHSSTHAGMLPPTTHPHTHHHNYHCWRADGERKLCVCHSKGPHKKVCPHCPKLTSHLFSSYRAW